MGGQSNRDKEATDLQGLLKSYYSDINKEGFKTDNVWKDYQTPFNYDKMGGVLDKVTDANIGKVNRMSDMNIQSGQQDAAARLASQGITGGSIGTNVNEQIRTGVNKDRFNTVSDIMTDRTSKDINLMDLENRNKFNVNNQNQGQLNQETFNLFRKFGLLGSGAGLQMGNLQNLDDTTGWDDLFAGLNAVGNLGKGAEGAASAVQLLSDVRFKENMIKVGQSPSGVNIYEFNYKNNPKRYRGAMAQENPDASINVNGIFYLDYSKLDVNFEEL